MPGFTTTSEFVSNVQLPATREELVNQLLVYETPPTIVSVFHRLPRDRYESRDDLSRDVEEISALDIKEIGEARTFEDLLAIVHRNVGDIDHATKALYDRVVDGVIEGAREQGNLSDNEVREMHDRLLGSYADLRKPMSETYDYNAPRNPNFDLPQSPPER